jgi:hypothetical protein
LALPLAFEDLSFPGEIGRCRRGRKVSRAVDPKGFHAGCFATFAARAEPVLADAGQPPDAGRGDPMGKLTCGSSWRRNTVVWR